MSIAATSATNVRIPVEQFLNGLVNRFGGAIEFWTVACLSQNDLGDAHAFVDIQWNALLNDLQSLRLHLAATEVETTPIVQEQLLKLLKACADLREVFDHLIQFATCSQKELESALARLGQLWDDFRMRIAFMGVLLAFPAPAPILKSEQDVYYHDILDGLFDRFEAARPKSIFDTDSDRI